MDLNNYHENEGLNIFPYNIELQFEHYYFNEIV